MVHPSIWWYTWTPLTDCTIWPPVLLLVWSGTEVGALAKRLTLKKCVNAEFTVRMNSFSQAWTCLGKFMLHTQRSQYSTLLVDWLYAEIYVPWTVSLFAAQGKQAQDGPQFRQEACWVSECMGRTYRSITGQHSRSAVVYKYKRKLFRIHVQWRRYLVHLTFYAVHQNGRLLKLRNLYDVIAIALYSAC